VCIYVIIKLINLNDVCNVWSEWFGTNPFSEMIALYWLLLCGTALLGAYVYRANLVSWAFAQLVKRQLKPYLRSSNNTRQLLEDDAISPLSVQAVPGGAGLCAGQQESFILSCSTVSLVGKPWCISLHTGLVISNINVDVGLFGNPRERPVLLDALAISTLEITYPSFTQPLSLRIKGACVEMRQNRNPKVIGAPPRLVQTCARSFEASYWMHTVIEQCLTVT